MRTCIVHAVVLAALAVGLGRALSTQTCTTDTAGAVVQPDAQAMLVALVAHSRQGEGSLCGVPDTDTMQGYEAMRWALQRINQDSGQIDGNTVTQSYVPGIKIGMKVYDTCGQPSVTSKRLLHALPQVESRDMYCTTNMSQMILGVIGPSYGDTTSIVADTLNDVTTSEITYSATSPSLNDANEYPFLLKTLPSDQLQIKVIIEILEKLNWTNIAVVYTTDDYGEGGYKQFVDQATSAKICVAKAIGLSPTETADAPLRAVYTGVLKTDAIGVVYFGRVEVLRRILRKAVSVQNSGKLQWIASNAVGRDRDIQTSISIGIGMLTVEPASRTISEFSNYWLKLDENSPSKENPWYKAWYMAENRCRLQNVNYSPFTSYSQCTTQSESERKSKYRQSQHVEPAIVSVFTFARALRDAQKALCGEQHVGVCTPLQQMTPKEFHDNYVMKIDFEFSQGDRIASLASATSEPLKQAKTVKYEDNNIVSPAYTVWQLTKSRQYKQVGIYKNNALDFQIDTLQYYDIHRDQPARRIPKSSCPKTGCADCLSVPSTIRRHAYLPGDVSVVGVFSIHKPGSSPSLCGEIDKHHGAQYAQAFTYAIKKLHNYFPSMKVGGLILDDCGSPVIGGNLISSFQSGVIKLAASDGSNINPSSAQAYVAAQSTRTTMVTCEVLSGTGTPIVGYKSSNTDISKNFPQYINMVPSDKTRAILLVKLLKRLEWSFIQTIVGEDKDSQMAYSEFKEVATEAGVCIAASHPAGTDNVIQLLLKKPQARAVIPFISHKQLLSLIEQFNTSPKASHFVLIGDEKWNDYGNIAEDFTTAIDGSIVLKLKTPELTAFKNSLAQINPEKYDENPWFRSWYESVFDCFLDDTKTNNYKTKCSKTDSITTSKDFKVNQNTLSVMNAVYAIAKGLDETIKHYCGSTSNGMCDAYKNADDSASKLASFIKKANFVDEVSNNFRFTSGGEGFYGYEITQYKQGQYVKVGEYNPIDESISLEKSKLDFSSKSDLRSMCSGVCTECLYMYKRQMYMFIPGDVMVGSLFNIHRQGDTPLSCGALAGMDALYADAMAYAIDKVNKGTAPVSLGKVKLGGLALDDCTSSIRVETLLSGLHSGLLSVGNQKMPVDTSALMGWLTYGNKETIAAASVLHTLGLPHISPSASAVTLTEAPMLFRTLPTTDKLVAGMASLIKKMGWRYVQTVYSADEYGKRSAEAFKRVSPSADVCILASHELSEKHELRDVIAKMSSSSTSVVVLLVGKEYVNPLLRDVNSLRKSFVFISGDTWGNSYHILNGTGGVAQNALTFHLASPQLQDFNTYLSTKYTSLNEDNPWSNEYYQMLYKCDLDNEDMSYGTSCGKRKSITDAAGFMQDHRVLTTINAVYAFAKAVHLSLSQKCGAKYETVCEEFRRDKDAYKLIRENLEKVSFTDPAGKEFSFEDKQSTMKYSLNRYDNGTYDEIGTYDKSSLMLGNTKFMTAYKNTESSCPGKCVQCKSVSRKSEEFTYIPGDVILAGIFDVHKSGGDVFSCGKINTNNGFQLLEGFNFAIDYVNNKTGIFKNILRGVSIGGIGLDACQSPLRAGNLAANVHSGILPLVKENKAVDPARIGVYIGGSGDQESVQIANVLNILSLPQISYGSSGIALGNREKYPFFLRTVPADDKQARAMIAVLKRFKLQYVQVVYTEDYSEETVSLFSKLAESNSICIAQKITFGSTIKEVASYAVRDLLKKPKAKVVIVFVRQMYINALLEAVGDVGAEDKFMFLGSKSWANDQSVISEGGKNAKNAITIGVENADVPSFDAYLETKTPQNYNRNPWFKEYYETLYECSLQPGSSSFPKSCSSGKSSVVYSNNYKQDPFLIYTVDAVFSAALGLHKALQTLCGQNYVGLCESYRLSGEKPQQILNGIKAAKFADLTKQTFGFDDDGESTRGFQIYTVMQSGGNKDSYFYKTVGSFDDQNKLKIDSSFDVVWRSSCSDKGSCAECSLKTKTSSQYMVMKHGSSSTASQNLNIVGMFDVHRPGSGILKCGDMDVSGGFQNLLALSYSLELVNTNKNINLPSSIKFSGLVFDTCSSKLKTQQVVSNYLSSDVCMDSKLRTDFNPANTATYLTQGTDNSLVANDLLSTVKQTVISPSSTSVSLENKPYLLRISPPDYLQALVMLRLVEHMKVNYIATIHSDDMHGKAAAEAFHSNNKVKDNQNLCITSKLEIGDKSTMENAKEIINTLVNKNGLVVVLLFTNPEHTRLLLRAAKEMNQIGRFQWVGSNLWGNRNQVVSGLEDVANGAITLQMRSEVIDGYMDYVKSLDFSKAEEKGIPLDWFEEFWQHTLSCRLSNGTKPLNQYTTTCKSSARITDDVIHQGRDVFNVIIATYMTAQGINNVEECRNKDDVFVCLTQLTDKGQHIFKGVKTAQWMVTLNESKNRSFNFKFTDAGYGDLGYVVYNYLKHKKSGTYSYNKVGQWIESLVMESSNISVTSKCPSDEKCTCSNFKDNNGNGTTVSTGPKTGELKAPAPDQNFTKVWGIVLAILSGLGIIITVILFIYLLIFYPVRSGTSILGYILLVGILCIYVVNFAFIMNASNDICGIRRFCLGFVYSIVFVCMLMKSLNNWRLGGYSEDATQSYQRLTHPCSFFLIAIGLVLVQVIIGVEWLILRPPLHELVKIQDEIIPLCVPADFHSQELILSCVYVMVLILLTLVFSRLTFSSEENNRESRWILASCCFTVGIWLIWTVLSTMTSIQYRDPAIVVANLVNATIILMCMYIRKLYLLSKYHKEVEDERKSHYSVNASQKGGRDDVYSAVYDNHAYDNVDSPTSERGGRAGSGIMYVYSGRKDNEMHY